MGSCRMQSNGHLQKNQQHCCASGKFAQSSTIKDKRDQPENISVNDKKKKSTTEVWERHSCRYVNMSNASRTF